MDTYNDKVKGRTAIGEIVAIDRDQQVLLGALALRDDDARRRKAGAKVGRLDHARSLGDLRHDQRIEPFVVVAPSIGDIERRDDAAVWSPDRRIHA